LRSQGSGGCAHSHASTKVKSLCQLTNLMIPGLVILFAVFAATCLLTFPVTHFHKYTYVIPYLSRKRKNIVAAPPSLKAWRIIITKPASTVNTKRQRLDIGFPSKLHPLKTHGSVRWDFAPWRSTFEHQEAKIVGYYKLRLWDAKRIISRAHWHKTRCHSRRTSRGVTSARKDHIWWAGRWVYKPGIMRSLDHPPAGLVDALISAIPNASARNATPAPSQPFLKHCYGNWPELHTRSLDHRGSLSGVISAITLP
jgi:hypothetical protein